jgi:hypothetical protein
LALRGMRLAKLPGLLGKPLEPNSKAHGCGCKVGRLSEIVSDYKRPFILFFLRLRSLPGLVQRSFPFFAGVVLGALLAGALIPR